MSASDSDPRTTVVVRTHPTLGFHARAGVGAAIRSASSRRSIVEAVQLAAARYLGCEPSSVEVRCVRRLQRETPGQYVASLVTPAHA